MSHAIQHLGNCGHQRPHIGSCHHCPYPPSPLFTRASKAPSTGMYPRITHRRYLRSAPSREQIQAIETLLRSIILIGLNRAAHMEKGQQNNPQLTSTVQFFMQHPVTPPYLLSPFRLANESEWVPLHLSHSPPNDTEWWDHLRCILDTLLTGPHDSRYEKQCLEEIKAILFPDQHDSTPPTSPLSRLYAHPTQRLTQLANTFQFQYQKMHQKSPPYPNQSFLNRADHTLLRFRPIDGFPFIQPIVTPRPQETDPVDRPSRPITPEQKACIRAAISQPGPGQVPPTRLTPPRSSLSIPAPMRPKPSSPPPSPPPEKEMAPTTGHPTLASFLLGCIPENVRSLIQTVMTVSLPAMPWIREPQDPHDPPLTPSTSSSISNPGVRDSDDPSPPITPEQKAAIQAAVSQPGPGQVSSPWLAPVRISPPIPAPTRPRPSSPPLPSPRKGSDTRMVCHG